MKSDSLPLDAHRFVTARSQKFFRVSVSFWIQRVDLQRPKKDFIALPLVLHFALSHRNHIYVIPKCALWYFKTVSSVLANLWMK